MYFESSCNHKGRNSFAPSEKWAHRGRSKVYRVKILSTRSETVKIIKLPGACQSTNVNQWLPGIYETYLHLIKWDASSIRDTNQCLYVRYFATEQQHKLNFHLRSELEIWEVSFLRRALVSKETEALDSFIFRVVDTLSAATMRWRLSKVVIVFFVPGEVSTKPLIAKFGNFSCDGNALSWLQLFLAIERQSDRFWSVNTA